MIKKGLDFFTDPVTEQVMEAISGVPYFRVVARQYMLQTIIREHEFQLTGATDKASIDNELDTAREKFREAVKNDDGSLRARRNLARISQGIPMTL